MKFTGGLPETACGAGSTLKTTENLRSHLPGLLKDLGIVRLLDAPCGDYNWMSQTDLRGIEYHGIDNSPQNLTTALGRPHAEGYQPARRVFDLADVTGLVLPTADGIMCRDFFQHLETEEILWMLQSIRPAKFKWLLATSFDNEKNEEIGPDMFRPINIQISPFNLGAPERAIDDPPGSGRILGAWRL